MGKFEVVRMSGLFPLTPALSPRERGNRSQSLDTSWRASFAEALTTILPLPKGEGWGEGEENARSPSGVPFATTLPTSDFGLTSFGFRASGFEFQSLHLL